jgi:hypothetical protein
LSEWQGLNGIASASPWPGNDAALFARYPAEGTPVLNVHRNSRYPSRVELPVMGRP